MESRDDFKAGTSKADSCLVERLNSILTGFRLYCWQFSLTYFDNIKRLSMRISIRVHTPRTYIRITSSGDAVEVCIITVPFDKFSSR